MNETMVCAVGNVATRPVYRDLAAGASARFRLAVTSRYWDREKNTWTDGHTNFFTVWANRQLAANTMASLNVGDPVIVQGRLKVRTEQREGQQNWTSADIDAVAIGHDIARGTSAFRRSGRPEPMAAGAPAQPEPNWQTSAATSAERVSERAPEPEWGPERGPEPGPERGPERGPVRGSERRSEREPVRGPEREREPGGSPRREPVGVT
ncbi:single-stranded DNA-binding protein [Streptomyces sp. ME18-1-4]|nr:single-stranded DNA-binding protein [Streptomyces sp. ME18-1-4]MDX3247708.1 single-stranded DNA-binding protein [Streptomyces sp. ME18-1-4]